MFVFDNDKNINDKNSHLKIIMNTGHINYELAIFRGKRLNKLM